MKTKSRKLTREDIAMTLELRSDGVPLVNIAYWAFGLSSEQLRTQMALYGATGTHVTDNELKRNIVGDTEIITETIIKSYETKNVWSQTTQKKVVKAILLTCGHKIPKTKYNATPNEYTECHECLRERTRQCIVNYNQ